MNKPFIIGLAGKARCGKDTAAQMILLRRRNFIRYAFADPLKEAVNNLLGWDERHSDGRLKEVVDPYWGASPRQAYQTFGTEWARKYMGEAFWLKVAERRLEGQDYVVIPDVRFDNEAEFVRKRGILVHVYSNRVAKVAEHSSEDGVKRKPQDMRLLNYGTLALFKMEVLDLLGAIEARQMKGSYAF